MPAACLSSFSRLQSSIRPLDKLSAARKRPAETQPVPTEVGGSQDPGVWGSASFGLREIPLPVGTTRGLGVGRALGDLSRERCSTSFPQGTKVKPTGRGKGGVWGGVCFQSPKEIYPNFLQL